MGETYGEVWCCEGVEDVGGDGKGQGRSKGVARVVGAVCLWWY